MTSRVPKVFCVGFNKTGTMTLSRLFANGLGLRAAHNFRWTDWSIARATAELDQWDAFSDGGCASIRNLDELYPDARFILNTRPLRSWVLSRHKAVERSREATRWLLTNYVPLGFIARVVNSALFLDNSPRAMLRWIRIRNSYHAHVLERLGGRAGKLLVVNVEDASAPAEIARFLGLPAPTGRTHANQDGHGTMTRTILDAIGDQIGARRSEELVDAFFADHCPEGRDTLTSLDPARFRLSHSASDRVLRTLPFLRGAVRRPYVGLVSIRARRRSYLAKWLLDLDIRFLRSEEDLDYFTTAHRFGSGEK